MSGAKHQQATVLIVDDEPLNVELLCQELEVEGYRLVSMRKARDVVREEGRQA